MNCPHFWLCKLVNISPIQGCVELIHQTKGQQCKRLGSVEIVVVLDWGNIPLANEEAS